MRTSGNDQDTALFVIPIIVLAIIATVWFGGPTATIRAIDSGILNALYWVRSQLQV